MSYSRFAYAPIDCATSGSFQPSQLASNASQRASAGDSGLPFGNVSPASFAGLGFVMFSAPSRASPSRSPHRSALRRATRERA
jgi:hypothetical protein